MPEGLIVWLAVGRVSKRLLVLGMFEGSLWQRFQSLVAVGRFFGAILVGNSLASKKRPFSWTMKL